jgi:hypothetical protein
VVGTWRQSFRDCLLTRTRQNAILGLNARIALKNKEELAHPTRFERVTFAFGGHGSNNGPCLTASPSKGELWVERESAALPLRPVAPDTRQANFGRLVGRPLRHQPVHTLQKITLDHPDYGISRDEMCKWGIEWDLCAPGLYGSNLPKNSVGRSAQKPSGLIFAFHSICLPTEHPVETA